jgi:hypothetical protein
MAFEFVGQHMWATSLNKIIGASIFVMREKYGDVATMNQQC